MNSAGKGGFSSYRYISTQAKPNNVLGKVD